MNAVYSFVRWSLRGRRRAGGPIGGGLGASGSEFACPGWKLLFEIVTVAVGCVATAAGSADFLESGGLIFGRGRRAQSLGSIAGGLGKFHSIVFVLFREKLGDV